MNTLIIERIAQETEKAVEIIIQARRQQDGEFHAVKIWMPKSQVEVKDNTVTAPEWLLEKKIDEVGEKYDFDCDGLMMVGLPPSTALTKDEAKTRFDAWMDMEAVKKAKKEAARARKAAKKL